MTAYLTTHFQGQSQHHNYHHLKQTTYPSMISFLQVTRVNLFLPVKLPDFGIVCPYATLPHSMLFIKFIVLRDLLQSLRRALWTITFSTFKSGQESFQCQLYWTKDWVLLITPGSPQDPSKSFIWVSMVKQLYCRSSPDLGKSEFCSFPLI